MAVGALILAAGFSRRFGSSKLEARLASGLTVFEQTCTRIATACDHIQVITRPDLLESLSAHCANISSFADSSQGMGASLAFGIQYAKTWDACLVCLADMPFIAPDTYRQIANLAATDRIVIPQYEDRPGNPVAFGSDFYTEISTLHGDSGGRSITTAHPEAVIELTVSDRAILRDIDTPKDLR